MQHVYKQLVTAPTRRSGPADDRARQLALRLVRFTWAMGMLLVVGLLIFSIPSRWTDLKNQYMGQVGADVRLYGPQELVLSPWWNSPAARAGLLDGDVLLAVNGTAVHIPRTGPLRSVLPTGNPGTKAALTVRRGIQTERYIVTLEGQISNTMGPVRIPATFIMVYAVATDVLSALLFLVLGLILFQRKPDDLVAVLAGLTFPMLFIGLSASVTTLYVSAGDQQRLLDIWYALASAGLYLFFFLFPDGALVPHWTRPAVVVLALWTLAEILVPSLAPWHMQPAPFLLLPAAWLCLGVVAQMWRYRWVSGVKQRQQMKWVVMGAGAAAVGALIQVWHFAWPDAAGTNALFDVGIYPLSRLLEVCLPATIGVAILRHRLFDIDLIINRALVYGGLTSLIVGGYVLIVGGVGSLLAVQGSLVLSLLATGMIALLFQPLRERLQHAANHLLYGDRDDPYAVLSRLGRRLETALAPEAVLPMVATTVKDALKLPYVAIVLRGERLPVVSTGAPPSGTVALPLAYAGVPVGELVLGLRGPGEALTAGDRRLLDDLAHQTGVAVQAMRLTTDLRFLTGQLQASRERLVLAREEERRRLRRDLHDDLAPALAALALTAATAADLIESDPVAARVMVKDLTGAIRASVADIRRLVYDLRPPTLDELGLVAAIRERAARYDGRAEAADIPLRVTVDAPDELGLLSAAVEVAAYRIVQEALMNVVRHAQARWCHIALTREGGDEEAAKLVVTVLDDGVGVPSFGDDGVHQRGVGLRSMQERAAELGGWCEIERAVPGGTRVQAWLPVHLVVRGEGDGTSPGPDC